MQLGGRVRVRDTTSRWKARSGLQPLSIWTLYLTLPPSALSSVVFIDVFKVYTHL
jgi:hypothetical protein